MKKAILPAAETKEGYSETMKYDFKQFSNVNITGIDLSSLSEEELAVGNPSCNMPSQRRQYGYSNHPEDCRRQEDFAGRYQ